MSFNLNIYTNLLPTPFREVVQARNAVNGAQSTDKAQLQKVYDEKFTKLAVRVAVVAAASLAVLAGLDYLTTLAFTAVFLSLPAALIMSGTWGLAASAYLIADSLATGFFLKFAVGAFMLGMSYMNIEFASLPDLSRFGIVEYTMEQMAQARAAVAN